MLPDTVKRQRETLQEWIQRKDKEMQGTLIGDRYAGHPALSDRAKRRGHAISAGYLDNLANGKATNPSAKLMEAIAAAYAVPLTEIIAVVFDLPSDQAVNGIARDLIEKYETLPPSKQREKQPLLEMVIRELQR
jgi:transcriptional regulator with XRE-family HTH domain